ncbi:hypothetical protein LXL04_014153 [Taraxacum kok-saghyz]
MVFFSIPKTILGLFYVMLCKGLLWYHANICCTFDQYFWWWSKKELKSQLWKAWLNSNSIPIKRRLIQIWGYWWNFLFRLQLPIVCKRYGLAVMDFWTKSWIFQRLHGHKRYIKTWVSVGFFGLLQTSWEWYLMLSLLRWGGGQIGIQFRRKRNGWLPRLSWGQYGLLRVLIRIWQLYVFCHYQIHLFKSRNQQKKVQVTGLFCELHKFTLRGHFGPLWGLNSGFDARQKMDLDRGYFGLSRMLQDGEHGQLFNISRIKGQPRVVFLNHSITRFFGGSWKFFMEHHYQLLWSSSDKNICDQRDFSDWILRLRGHFGPFLVRRLVWLFTVFLQPWTTTINMSFLNSDQVIGNKKQILNFYDYLHYLLLPMQITCNSKSSFLATADDGGDTKFSLFT